MRMRRTQRAAVFAAAFAMAVGGTALASAATAQPAQVRGVQATGIQHVLLISVDGLHQQDLTWYVNNFPDSTLAALDHQGLEYSNAMTPFPSDSFPGMVGQVTGGNPKTTGIYYDDTWNHDVFPIGTTNCSGPQTACNFVKNYLLTHPASGNNISDQPITVSSSGLRHVYAGSGAANFIGVPASDPRVPQIIGISQYGTVYTGGTSKIAEHGGDALQDRNVPILVVLPGQTTGSTISTPVETTQIAPTILTLLGLNPNQLQAVQMEHTQVLPGISG
jgi:Type I phosphodiesterase / nucleotide pyrophosphatase